MQKKKKPKLYERNNERRMCLEDSASGGPSWTSERKSHQAGFWFLVVQIGVGKGGTPANLKFPTEWKFRQREYKDHPCTHLGIWKDPAS